MLIVKHFPKSDNPHSRYISGNTDSERHGQIHVQKAVFQRILRDTTWQMGRNSVAI